MHNAYNQRVRLLLTIEEMLDAFEQGEKLSGENWDDMRDALSALGLPEQNIMFTLIESCRKSNSNIKDLQKYFSRFFDALMSAAANSSMISEDYKTGKYGSDREFISFREILSNNSVEVIVAFVLEKLKNVQESNPDYYRLLTEESKGWFHETNWLDGIGGANNSLITNRVSVLKNNVNRLEWLYSNLSDALSRRSLIALIKYWLTWDYTDWRNIAVYSHDVVDTTVYPFYEDEVFIDSGSYIGDTVVQYVNTVNNEFKRVYTYDISSASIEAIKKNLSQLSNVIINHKGTGEVNTEMDMVGFDQVFHGNKLVEANLKSSVEKVKVVRLDDDIDEPVTFLKIDCEGFDKETLRGAQGIIKKYHPKLHVDSYHKLADLVDIPWLIREIDASYVLYMRLPKHIDLPMRFPAPAYFAL